MRRGPSAEVDGTFATQIEETDRRPWQDNGYCEEPAGACQNAERGLATHLQRTELLGEDLIALFGAETQFRRVL